MCGGGGPGRSVAVGVLAVLSAVQLYCCGVLVSLSEYSDLASCLVHCGDKQPGCCFWLGPIRQALGFRPCGWPHAARLASCCCEPSSSQGLPFPSGYWRTLVMWRGGWSSQRSDPGACKPLVCFDTAWQPPGSALACGGPGATASVLLSAPRPQALPLVQASRTLGGLLAFPASRRCASLKLNSRVFHFLSEKESFLCIF